MRTRIDKQEEVTDDSIFVLFASSFPKKNKTNCRPEITAMAFFRLSRDKLTTHHVNEGIYFQVTNVTYAYTPSFDD
jgi:hypothetical protein